MPMNDLSLRTHEILENTLQFELTGSTDEGSHRISQRRGRTCRAPRWSLDRDPVLRSRPATAAADLQVSVNPSAMTGQFKSYERPNGTWTPVQSLTATQREQLDGDSLRSWSSSRRSPTSSSSRSARRIRMTEEPTTSTASTDAVRLRRPHALLFECRDDARRRGRWRAPTGVHARQAGRRRPARRRSARPTSTRVPHCRPDARRVPFVRGRPPARHSQRADLVDGSPHLRRHRRVACRARRSAADDPRRLRRLYRGGLPVDLGPAAPTDDNGILGPVVPARQVAFILGFGALTVR